MCVCIYIKLVHIHYETPESLYNTSFNIFNYCLDSHTNKPCFCGWGPCLLVVKRKKRKSALEGRSDPCGVHCNLRDRDKCACSESLQTKPSLFDFSFPNDCSPSIWKMTSIIDGMHVMWCRWIIQKVFDVWRFHIWWGIRLFCSLFVC